MEGEDLGLDYHESKLQGDDSEKKEEMEKKLLNE